MPLTKQVIPVSMLGGLDTLTDEHQVVPGSWLELENFNFETPKALRTRNGYGTIGGGLTSGTSVAAYLEELLVTDARRLYSYNAGLDELGSKGVMTSVYCTQRPIVRNNFDQNQPDSVTDPVSRQILSAWEESSGVVTYSVIDELTGQPVAQRTLPATAIKPKTLVIGNTFVVLFVDTTNPSDLVLCMALLPVATPGATPTIVAISNGTNVEALSLTEPNYDACISADALYVVMQNRNVVPVPEDVGIAIFKFDEGSLLAPILTHVTNEEPAAVLTVFPDSAAEGIVIAFYTGLSLQYLAYTASLENYAGDSLETVANVVSLTGVSFPSSTLVAQLYYGVKAEETRDYLTRTTTITAGGGGSASVFRRSVSPAGKAFLQNGVAYLPVAYQSAENNTGDPNLQSQYLLLDSDGNRAARVLYGLGGGIPKRPDDVSGAAMLPETSSPSPGLWRMAALVKTMQTTLFKADYQAFIPTSDPSKAPADYVYVYSPLGVTALSFDFGAAAGSYRRAELAETLTYGGGLVQGYDGKQLTENNFVVYPEPFGVEITATSGGGLEEGLHSYRVCYAWTDARGQVHRSSPSVPVSIEIESDSSYTTLTIPTDRLSNKPGMVIEVYRTVMLGEGVPSLIYYKVTTTEIPAESGATNAPILNDPSVDSVTFIDKMNETAPQGRPYGYWSGGVFENQCPSPLGALTVLHNRIFGIDTLNPMTLWYSKQVTPGAPVEFTPWQTINMDPRGGEVTALGAMDAALIVFKKGSLFRQSGVGPDAAGGNFDFQDPELITTDVGCESPRSVVIVPDMGDIPGGLMFQAANGKGFHLLTRGYQIVPIGAQVKRYANETVTSAQLMADKKQVVFTLASGIALVYDYFLKLWTTYTNVNAADSCVWQGTHVFITPDGGVRRETPGVYNDDGKFIACKAVSAWFALQGIQGFGRLYKMLILGSLKSSHRLLASLAFDYKLPSQTVEITPPTLNAWGDDSVWGGNPDVATDTTVWGGAFPLYQFRVFPKQQKCEAFQFTLETAPMSSAAAGEAVVLSAISFEIGSISGAKRMPARNSYGR